MGLASLTGRRLLAVPSPLSAEGMLDEAAWMGVCIKA